MIATMTHHRTPAGQTNDLCFHCRTCLRNKKAAFRRTCQNTACWSLQDAAIAVF